MVEEEHNHGLVGVSRRVVQWEERFLVIRRKVWINVLEKPLGLIAIAVFDCLDESLPCVRIAGGASLRGRSEDAAKQFDDAFG